MNFTPDQQRAISSFDQNVIVVAGAGSGKTAVLVQRYLALLDAHPEWPLNALVAITFTEKAAGEMRDRVRQALEARFASATTDDARALWSARVGAMDSARIDTFHSLCAAILRANAAEAGIDPRFSVLDEIDARILLDNVIDDALRALVAESDPAVRLFAEYDASLIRETVMSFTGVTLPPMPDDLFSHWQTAWEADARAELDAFLRAEAAAALAFEPAYGWPDVDDKLLDNWRLVRDALDRLHPDDLASAREPLAAISAISFVGGAAKAWGDKDAVDAAKAPLKPLRERARAVLAVLGEPLSELDRRAAGLVPLWVTLIQRVQALYRETKATAAALDFDDLEARARDLLLNNPSVRARYAGAEFRHLLVDEFQDTNAAQWEIVRALADPAEPGSLFLVGDARQSIYAFRGADVSVFERVRRYLLEVAGQNSEVTLAQSFRTHRGLIDCFNMIFTHILTRDPHSPVQEYQIELGAAMQAFRVEAPCDRPAVEICLIESSRGDGVESSSATRRAQEADTLAARIRALVEEGRPVYDKRLGTHRPIGYGDVALLFQSTSAITLYEDALKRAGLPFVTVAGRGYYDRQEVWDLVNLLDALYNTSDDLALASVLRSPLFSLSDDALLAMRLNGDRQAPPPLWLALADAASGLIPALADDDRARAEFAATCLGELSDLAGRVTIAELLRMALDQTGYLATLTGLPDGARRRGNVEKLLDKATSSGKITLGAFSQYLRDLTENEAREGEALLDVEGVITLMTVHRAKGLEFPLVALVDTSWRRGDLAGLPLVLDPVYGLCASAFDPAQEKLAASYAYRRAHALRQAREDAERRRLLYVAATRAQDYLLISGQVTRNVKGEVSTSGWLRWLLEAFDLTVFEPETDMVRPYPWGQVHLRVLPARPDASRYDPVDRSAWEAALPTTAAAAPPLLGEPPIRRDAPVRSLTGAQVADLGAIDLPGEGAFYKRRLRRSLFYDAPAHIEQVIAPGQWVSNSKIGDMVHKALRWWRFPTEADDLEAVLRGYAWEVGVTEPVQQAVAVQIARRLLRRMQATPLYAALNAAQTVYRQVPFVYDSGAHSINGVVDVIFQQPDGTWTLLDYKTVDVAEASEPDAVAAHAARYALRMGVYAAATREQLRRLLNVDVIPEVMLYYIHHGETVTLPAAMWQAALAGFETQVSKLLGQIQ